MERPFSTAKRMGRWSFADAEIVPSRHPDQRPRDSSPLASADSYSVRVEARRIASSVKHQVCGVASPRYPRIPAACARRRWSTRIARREEHRCNGCGLAGAGERSGATIRLSRAKAKPPRPMLGCETTGVRVATARQASTSHNGPRSSGRLTACTERLAAFHSAAATGRHRREGRPQPARPCAISGQLRHRLGPSQSKP